jgi:hypothetical protein
MEGRSPPPSAAHPFPDDAAAVNKKFWGTPAAKGFFKFTFWFGSIWMSALCLNYYFTKDETKFLGMDMTLTKEQFHQGIEARQSHPAKHNLNLSVSTVPNLIFPDKEKPKGYDLMTMSKLTPHMKMKESTLEKSEAETYCNYNKIEIVIQFLPLKLEMLVMSYVCSEGI